MAHLGKVNKSRIRFSLVTLNAASILNLTTHSREKFFFLHREKFKVLSW